ncbi:cysteine desulfurase family protein [Oribacterium sp. oral taxon 078 str. F0263]|uniref:aminotransferase class V-fold PLP-dependent enzyme n=1 Tax=Oribacterium sp. oral taxon 078 TaxID=652706 RepID=UPI0003ADD94C|nr:aminotransferase class V-fold PLP-dependent enzyme [Oribacterium sp. oral taxon 078]ERL04033.1 cysteine desulfurase family protein [Oribacterium sp. oral taxon 078 str. F0263]
MIYLDNAATSFRKPEEVLEAVMEAMRHSGNASRGTHSAAISASQSVYEARRRLAAFFHCERADHVIFTQNSTEALNIALYGLLSPGEHVITTDLEHNSVLRPLYDLESRGLLLDFVRADRRGKVDYRDFERLIRKETKAIVCTHASNLTGNMLELERISGIAHRAGALLVVDASQSAGALPVDMEKQGIDILCFTGHKSMLGPQGTGGLCLRSGVELRPFKRGGTGVHSYLREQPSDYPTRLEAGTLNGHGIAGLLAAVNFIDRMGLEKIEEKESRLLRRFCEAVREIPGVTLYGDFEGRRAAIAALNIRDYSSAEISDCLAQDYGIATRPGAHCAPRMHEALGTEEQGAVRFSFSIFNTEDEVESAIRAVRELAR